MAELCRDATHFDPTFETMNPLGASLDEIISQRVILIVYPAEYLLKLLTSAMLKDQLGQPEAD